MGSFSFMYADGGKENQANMVPGDRVRLLVPEVFGGGSLDGVYIDYGEIALADETTVDVYELLALWNSAELRDALIGGAGFCEEEVNVKGVDGVWTPFARNVGIRVGCYDEDMLRLDWPLRIVPAEKGGATYENVEGVSVGDPNQGFYARAWDEYAIYDLGESLGAYLSELREKNEREGRVPWGDVALTEAERERLVELPRMS